MSLTDTNLREKNFHNKLHSGNGKRSENIFYKAIFNLYKDFYGYLDKHSANKIVLDFGCGSGGITEKIAKQNPSKIVGIDISEISIKKAIENAKVLNLDIEYKVENCEKSSLGNNFFDLIYGTGILHHLNLKSSAKEINRLLKKDGQMVFMEPLGTNPFINLYRKLTPNARSEDEHPFVNIDFEFLEEVYGKLTVKYYGFFTLIFFFLYKSPEKSLLYKFFAYLDEMFFKIRFFRFLAWSVLIICKKN